MTCPRCGLPVRESARFCSACGARVHERPLVRRGSMGQVLAAHGRHARVLAVVFLGTLASVLLTSLAFAFTESHGALPLLLQSALLVLVGLWALRGLGEGALRESFGARPGVSGLVLGAIGGAAMFSVSLGYVAFLRTLLPEGPELDVELDPWLVVQVVVAAPLLEEWLCRGVLWRACRAITTRGSAIAVTALVFAMLHGLNGAYLLELPHRFVGGLLLGFLRARTDSLAPCVLAHFANNAAAIALAP